MKEKRKRWETVLRSTKQQTLSWETVLRSTKQQSLSFDVELYLLCNAPHCQDTNPGGGGGGDKYSLFHVKRICDDAFAMKGMGYQEVACKFTVIGVG